MKYGRMGVEELNGALVDSLKPHGEGAVLSLVFSLLFFVMLGLNFAKILAL